MVAVLGILALPVALLPWGSSAGGSRPSRAISLPGEFSGGLIDKEHQSTWSLGPTTRFSGYNAEFAFKDLAFRLKSGVYTLATSRVEVAIDVIQRETSPAGNGVCHTTFDFARTGEHPDTFLTGSLAGISRTGSMWHATVDLGLHMHGRSFIRAPDCGPNDAASEHPFGDPPRITVPIEVTGTLNLATRELTVADTSTYSVGKGTGEQTDKIEGSLRGS